MADVTVTVRECDTQPKDTGIDLNPGDRVLFVASGQIWSGVWFTGKNGPAGWAWQAGDKFFFPTGHPYSLLGILDGQYFEIGNGFEKSYIGKGSRLYLTINDDVHCNGNDAFVCDIDVYRAAQPQQPDPSELWR